MLSLLYKYIKLNDKSDCLLQTEVEGLTGTIRFNEGGHRKNFTLQVMELTVDGDMVKVLTQL